LGRDELLPAASFSVHLCSKGPKMSNSFYVYLHVRKSDGIVFYVGKGRGRRANYFNERNPHWHSVFKKHGCIVEFVCKNISENDAFRIERETIAKYKSDKLCNMTEGGEGVTGYRFTDEQKEKMSISGKKRLPMTEQSRKKLSESNLGRVNSEYVREHIRKRMVGNDYGKYRNITQELRDKIRLANTGEKNHTADQTKYNFYNKDGRYYFGTRYNLKRDTGDCVRALFYSKPNKSIYGWSLAL